MSSKVGISLLAAVLLTACGPSPLLRFNTIVINAGQHLPEDMRDRNVAGYVAFDEAHPSEYNRVVRGSLYIQGVIEGTPEYQMRVVRVNAGNPGSLLWVGQGDLYFPLAAMVPDQVQRLKAGDVVEVRQTGTWDTVVDFTKSGEGNIVVRVICEKARPDYEDCLHTKAPKLGKHFGMGETHTPYPASVKSYGYTFTPAYAEDGTALRNW